MPLCEGALINRRQRSSCEREQRRHDTVKICGAQECDNLTLLSSLRMTETLLLQMVNSSVDEAANKRVLRYP